MRGGGGGGGRVNHRGFVVVVVPDTQCVWFGRRDWGGAGTPSRCSRGDRQMTIRMGWGGSNLQLCLAAVVTSKNSVCCRFSVNTLPAGV